MNIPSALFSGLIYLANYTHAELAIQIIRYTFTLAWPQETQKVIQEEVQEISTILQKQGSMIFRNPQYSLCYSTSSCLCKTTLYTKQAAVTGRETLPDRDFHLISFILQLQTYKFEVS